jgi:hypothetical protein
LHQGSLDIGEVIVHQGFSQHAVNIQMEYLQLGNSENSWDNKAVSELMRSFYEKKNYLVLHNLPIGSWKPNPRILQELEKFTKTKAFAQNMDEFAKAGYHSKFLIERHLRREYAIVDSLETERYLSLFLNFVANMEGSSIEG